ncbi:MAG TPA: hypothetical protein VET83_04670 [Candidatus Dormibacteraeota bacterium]|nr:hypothetical protein [Candidatus Dormibacteraeota bacterium]
MALRRRLAYAWMALLFPVLPPGGPGFAGAADAPANAPASEARQDAASTPFQLFADVEEAWGRSDAERLTALLDTTTVRIALKPGAPLTFAVTRVAASFLLQDQLRLVHTRRFQMVRFDCDKKGALCRALAVWTGDWGGRQGPRAVRVAFTARPAAGGWLLTEIRAED